MRATPIAPLLLGLAAAATVEKDYCAIGAGPAGCQLGFFWEQAKRDYVILETGDGVGKLGEMISGADCLSERRGTPRPLLLLSRDVLQDLSAAPRADLDQQAAHGARRRPARPHGGVRPAPRLEQPHQ